jgi:hypothetical protein
VKGALFRCVKVVFEEKTAHTLEPKPTVTTEVTVQFELVGDFGKFGYAHLSMTPEEFKESGYQTGVSYDLVKT